MERAELRKLVLATGCADERGEFVFLRDPTLARAINGAQSATGVAAKAKSEKEKSSVADGWLCIATGGSSGALKFARHDERTLGAAVRGFCAHFGLERVNAVDVLPPFHVSGLMARVRCAATGGDYLAWEWKRLEAGERPELAARRDWLISLVPTQLQRLLGSEAAVAWLRRFKIIFLGGGPVWPELASDAARAELRVALTYGMTETAAMVAALRPEEFLGGARSVGAAMPQARVTLDAEGVVSIAGESVFRGYFPGWRDERVFETDDVGRIDERGHLHVLGRRDAVIITGGKKVQPTDVEAALRASGEFGDVAVIGVPDAEWGEAVVACYCDGGRKPDVKRAVRDLAPHQRPKRFVAIAAADWPRNPQGKINRAELARRHSRADAARDPEEQANDDKSAGPHPGQ
ncbi:MAG TPA: AMP-binding protein [Opitutaceae bacterium]|nr:AMP-binding protein [Opitutaceae bacterium]